jgi:hypothetical protein
MARSTAAEVEDRLGVYPAGWNATNVGVLCDSAYETFNNYLKLHYDTTLSDTDKGAIEIENEIVVNMIHRANALHAGKDTLPEIFTPEIIKMIEAVVTDTDSDGTAHIELQGRHSDT